MYATGMPVTGQLFFMYATMLISVPTGVKVFNWIATMWKGSMTFETPMLFAVGFIFVFTMGGFTGLILSMAPIDTQVQDTYYVVAHFHYVLVAGSLFAMFAGLLLLVSQVDRGDVQRNTRSDSFLVDIDFVQRDFLPYAFLGLGRYATSLCRLPHAVCGLQHGGIDWGVLLWLCSGVFLLVRGVACDAGPRPKSGG